MTKGRLPRHEVRMQPFLDPPVRQRSVAARRTAGLNRAEREARIVSLLNRGVAIAEIAAREGLSLKRMRNLVREILAQRMPQPPAES
jgi:DNA-binding NarL/FixJ family response regulator